MSGSEPIELAGKRESWRGESAAGGMAGQAIFLPPYLSTDLVRISGTVSAM